MPRRNNRRETYEPIDLTPADIRAHTRAKPTVYTDPAHARRERAKRRQEAAERQHTARINGGIDWTVCLVPGCGNELFMWGSPLHNRADLRDHKVKLPLCLDHLAVAYQQANFERDNPLMVEANTLLLERKEAKRREVDANIRKEWQDRHDGHIYFVRLNGLVKAGWSRDVDQRLRAYGPDVEVLAIYPGSRSDETNLHRQLRPALARGREWYEDGKIIADFVAKAVAEHGTPEVFTGWTSPKQVIRPRRRSA